MAEVLAMRNNVLPYPIYSLPYTFVFPVLDADGDLVTGGTSDTPDTELSKNGDTFADCTEAVEIATASGMYYISLTAAEMTCNVGALIFKTATAGTKTTPIVFYPRVLPVIRSATAQAGAVNSVTLDASASAVDNYYNGCVVYISAGTGAAQTRTIYDYTGSTKVALVSPNWTAPANDSTFYIYLTDNAWLNTAHLDAPISTVDTVADGIQTDLSNATDGLGALKTLLDAITAAGPTKAEMDTAHGLLATEAKQDTIDTVVDGIQTDLSNGTDGLGALKTLIDAITAAGPTKAEMDTAHALLATEAKQDIIDTNVDSALADTNELQTDWHDGGRLDVILDAAGGAGDPWITALPGAYGAGTAGKIIGDNINAPIATVDTVVDAIKAVTDAESGVKAVADAIQAKTDLIGASVAPANEYDTQLDANVSTRATPAQVATALTNYDAPTRAELTTDKNSIITEVNANETKIDTLTTNVGTVDTVVDGIQTDLSNATDGLGALKALIDTLDTVADGIQTDLSNGTDGLGALKALIDTIDTVVDAIKAVTDNLPDAGALNDLASILTDTGTTLPATLATIAGYIDTEITTIDTVVDAIKAKTDNLPADPADDSDIDAQLVTIAGYCDILDHASNGLANIKTLIDTLDTVADAVKAKTDLLPSGVPKNVALGSFVFLMVLETDHITPATGKTITEEISKDGGAFAACTNAAAEIGNGFYKIDLTQAEMNADVVALKFTEADCDQRSIVMVTST